jgi:hypothetical protein
MHFFSATLKKLMILIFVGLFSSVWLENIEHLNICMGSRESGKEVCREGTCGSGGGCVQSRDWAAEKCYPHLFIYLAAPILNYFIRRDG